MRLSNDKRDSIIESECDKKYYDKKAKAQKNLTNFLTEQVSKSVPKWITKEMLDSRYIKTECSIEMDYDFLNGLTQSEKRIANRQSIDSYYPCAGYHHLIKGSKTLESKIKKIDKINHDIKEFKSQLRPVLYGFTSSKKLLESLPELNRYFDTKEECEVEFEKWINDLDSDVPEDYSGDDCRKIHWCDGYNRAKNMYS